MTCNNCGAPIDKDQLLCPYCGAENEQEAREQQQEFLDQYKQKTKELQHIPKKVVNKTTKYLLIGAAVLFAIFIIGIAGSVIISKLFADNSLEKKQEQLDKLEAMYDAGEYVEMYAYLQELDEYGATYDKYFNVGQLYDQMQWRLDSLKSEQEFIKKIDMTVDDVATTIGYALEEMARIQEFADAGFKYGEEEAVLAAREAYVDALKTYMLLTDEEIEAAMQQYMEDKDCTEAAKLALKRNLMH